MNEKNRQEEVIKVIEWMAKNSNDLGLLVDDEDFHHPEDYIDVINRLEKESLEYLIPLVLYSGKKK